MDGGSAVFAEQKLRNGAVSRAGDKMGGGGRGVVIGE